MNATLENGDIWTGERNGEWWMCEDSKGNLYETRETPVYRIVMDRCTQALVNGKLAIVLIDEPKPTSTH